MWIVQAFHNFELKTQIYFVFYFPYFILFFNFSLQCLLSSEFFIEMFYCLYIARITSCSRLLPIYRLACWGIVNHLTNAGFTLIDKFHKPLKLILGWIIGVETTRIRDTKLPNAKIQCRWDIQPMIIRSNTTLADNCLKLTQPSTAIKG